MAGSEVKGEATGKSQKIVATRNTGIHQVTLAYTHDVPEFKPLQCF
jgi:hypothetical protein